MQRLIVCAVLVIGSVVAAQAVAQPAGPPARWTEYDATQRLTTGPFAARQAVAHATCLGTGKGAGPTYSRTFVSFDCKTEDKDFENERQLMLRVTGETTFTVKWLKGGPCPVG